MFCRYVLTYIPDLKWCHLAPMVQDGIFGDDKPKARGKPKWRLVNESLGREVDISSSYCIPIKSRSMRKTLDADKEEWDVIDDGTDPTKMPAITSRLSLERRDDFYHTTSRGTTAIKPSVERARKKPFSFADSPSLLAAIPGSGVITTVRLVGRSIFDDQSSQKRGRPLGSKNKPKSPTTLCAMDVTEDTKVASEKLRSTLPTIALTTVSDDAGGKRRSSVVQFNVPASVRKAAALRSSTEKKVRGRVPRSSISVPTTISDGNPNKGIVTSQSTLFTQEATQKIDFVERSSPITIPDGNLKKESEVSKPSLSTQAGKHKIDCVEASSAAEDQRLKRRRASLSTKLADNSEDYSSDSTFYDASSDTSNIAEELSLSFRRIQDSMASRRRHSVATESSEKPGRPRRSASTSVSETSGSSKRDTVECGQNSKRKANPRLSYRNVSLFDSEAPVGTDPTLNSHSKSQGSMASKRNHLVAAVPSRKRGRPSRAESPGLSKGDNTECDQNLDSIANLRRSCRNESLLRESPMNLPAQSRQRRSLAQEGECSETSLCSEVKTRLSRKSAPSALRGNHSPRRRRCVESANR